MAKTSRVESPILTVGSVQGRIESEPTLPVGQFVLHGPRWIGDVLCTLAPGRQDLLADAWGRRAYVVGRIVRERGTNRPLAIDDVTEITLLPDAEPGALLRAAEGIAPAPPGSPLPEERIRRMRDEE
jgi:hypothetical protein